ncbi:MAG TPA: hypothetical protein VN781_05450 [Acidimicrobiales bacterium]|nr:hypothetical protein [Acidimicrobiales bacterium]
MSVADPFDVEPYRGARTRRAVVRRCPRTTLVLGSTQPDTVVDRQAAARADVVVARRRTGGGAVLLEPEDPLWVDVWVPRGDPLFDDDAVRGVHWVGEWWSSALARLGVGPTAVQGAGRPVDRLASLVCFAGLGSGEVHRDGRKLVGVAQWRARQGALIHCAAYRHWSPGPLVDLLSLGSLERAAARQRLPEAALGYGQAVAGASRGALTSTLLDLLPDGGWDVSVEAAP